MEARSGYEPQATPLEAELGFENCWEYQNHTCGEMGFLGEISPPRPLPARPPTITTPPRPLPARPPTITTPPPTPAPNIPMLVNQVQVNLPWVQRSYYEHSCLGQIAWV